MAKKPTRSRNATSADPTTRYAEGVTQGTIVAGPHVRAACARHLRDLKSAKKRGFHFDVEAAQHALDFFPLVLRLSGGDYEGRPFVLLGWQQFVIGSIFGWRRADNGGRRFRIAYIETGKGSGKSPLVGGIGLYGLVADDEARAEIYAAATKREQAMILFRDAVAMVKLSPMLKRRLHLSGAEGSEWNIAFRDKGSFFRPIAADDNQSGPRVHMGLIDEIHEHKNDTVVEMLRAGTKSRKQALILMITNSGSNVQSVCWNYHEYGSRVAADDLSDDSFFSYICALDESDDPFTDESCWPKVNPSLAEADLPGYLYLREQVQTARGMPARESIVRRLNFCEWTQAHAPWIGADVWRACEGETPPPEALEGRRVLAGLDLASTTDLASLVLAFQPKRDDEPWDIVPYFWMPEDSVAERERRDRVPYTQWLREGRILTTPGKAISKLRILQTISGLHERYGIETLFYDRWRMADLVSLSEDEGIKLPEIKPFGQGYKDMSPAVDEVERMLLAGEIRHPAHPVLTWNAACATLEMDAAGNRKVSKARSTGRIDGVVAMLMALGFKGSRKEPKYQLLFV